MRIKSPSILKRSGRPRSLGACRVRSAWAAVTCLFVAASAVAGTSGPERRRGPSAVPERCLVLAATEWRVPIDALRLILTVEGGAVGECSTNSNGTVDCGPGQINSLWYPIIAAGRVSPQVIRDALASDPCYNVRVAAWILRREIDAVGWDKFWTAIGNYHSHTPAHHAEYLRRIVAAARAMPNTSGGERR